MCWELRSLPLVWGLVGGCQEGKGRVGTSCFAGSEAPFTKRMLCSELEGKAGNSESLHHTNSRTAPKVPSRVQ